MKSKFGHYWKNWKLEQARRKLSKESKRVSKEAREKKQGGIYEEWYSINGWEFDVIDYSIKENDSRDLIDQAEKRYLPTPSPNDKDKWVPKDELPPGYRWFILTQEAMAELRTAVRQEDKARLEIWELRFKIAGAVATIGTGLIGSLIGLVAILKK
jgi:hypothetical protein